MKFGNTFEVLGRILIRMWFVNKRFGLNSRILGVKKIDCKTPNLD